MRLGKVGLLRTCQVERHFASSSFRGASSSSPLALRPTSVLDWQRELLSPNPSSQKLLGKLHQAMQSSFPPIRQNQVWIEARDVQTTLNIIISENAVIPDQWKRKDRLDIIMLCVQRCLKDARRRVSFKVESDCERLGIILSDAEKEAQVVDNPTVKEWQNLTSSRWLRQHRLHDVIMARRRPSLKDLQEAFSIVQQGGRFGLNELNQLLNFIARFMPSPEEGEKKDQFLEMAAIPSELQLKVLDRAALINKTIPHLEKLLDDHEEEYLLPQDVVRLFEIVWERLCILRKPNAGSYSAALFLESRLAPWRSLLSGSVDTFEPISRVSVKLQKKKMLETYHVNQIMWAALRYDPFLLQHSINLSDDFKWPDIEDCVKVYQEMRGNAVQIEMEWERRQNGEPSKILGPNQWRNNSNSNPILQRQKGLPVDLIPDQTTYELLIRGFTWRGELRRAASLFDEMIQSDVETKDRLIKLQKDKGDSKEEERPSLLYSATFSTFDSFFRGFAKHSIPYSLVYYNAESPEMSEWTLLEGEKEQNDWSIHALIDLFEAYLKLDPRACRGALEGYRSKEVLKERTWLFEEEVDKDDWSLDLDDSMMQLWISILSLENPEVNLQKTCPAPSPQQLFFLLTALRRTSNDDAQWVLIQWQRVVDKFSLSAADGHKHEYDEGGINKEGWTGWRLNDRLVRVLEHLQSKL